ncbi:MFS transporter [Streptomyces flavidovirens]|uniref:MFS transporter n=1 Tax=Streptomyces flavidovirens TaxID=67298 RepID=UPI000402EF52|nr:MFS transporter [Streptomyces flavidovirens]
MSDNPPGRRPATTARPGAAGAAGAVGPVVIIGVFGVTLGITYPLFALMLERQGVSGTVVGLNGAMTPLGMVLTAALIPAAVRRWGPWTVMVSASVGTSAILSVLALTDSLGLWFVLRFVLGACAVAMFILSETWISAIASDANRARLFTAYTSVLALGFCIGPAVLTVSGNAPGPALTVAVASPLLALWPLCTGRRRVPGMAASGAVPVGALARQLSVLLVAVLTVSVFDAVTLQFLPLYGEAAGLTSGQAAFALTALLIGQILFQFPLGWLADRLGARTALLLSLLVGALGALLLPFAVDGGPGWLYPTVALWGGIAFAGYPLVLTLLGEGLRGTSLLLANTAFAIVWGVGGVLGPPYTGAATDWLGVDGMPWSLTALWLVALVVTAGAFAAGRGKAVVGVGGPGREPVPTDAVAGRDQ